MRHRLFAFMTILAFTCAAASSALATDKEDYYSGLDLYHAGDYAGAAKAFRTQMDKTPSDEAVKKWLDLAEKRVAEMKDTAPTSGTQESESAPFSPKPPAFVPAPPEKTPDSETAVGNEQENYERGIALYLSGDYQSSLDHFNNHLKANPDHVATQQWISLVKALVPGEHATKKDKRTLAITNQKMTTPALNTSAAAPTATKPITIPVPTPPTAESPKPAPEAPQATAPIPAVDTDREKELESQIAILRQELKTSEETAQRAIDQTKKALAIPNPDYQSYEQENIRKSMATEIDNLHARQEELTAQLRDANETNTRLQQEATQARLAQAQSPVVDTSRVEMAENELKGLRETLERMSKEFQASQEELTRLQASHGRLLSDMRKKEVELSDAKSELENRSAQEQQYANAVQKSRMADEARIKAEQRAEQLQKDVDIATSNSAEAQRTLAQMAAQVQDAEDARADADRKLAELTQRTRNASGELESLRASHDKLLSKFDANSQLIKELDQKFGDAQKQLEESRAQGLRLVLEAQKERSLRQDLESKASAREDKIRGELAAIKAQLGQTMPQLQAMQATLEDLGISDSSQSSKHKP